MRTFDFKEYGRVIVMHLRKGDPVLESITEGLKEKQVKNAVLLSGIGSFRKLSLHGIKACSDTPSDYYYTLEAPVELGCLQGIVLDGVPHLHAVCSTPDGKTYVGHLEPGCEAQFLVELSFLEVPDMKLTRRLDEFGIGYIDVL
ncbi:MAG: DNA-binding protein [Oscillibacter sp.]|nr:PPC domain-containing DNA-binding protein [uncultured Oscillibacter sp.]MCI8971903.1 DNA-binding protein [Oscillibacter sp.]